ncbi:uncharacterized protein DEA37_0013710 [Paragonimus westermani]|uniref:HYDIN/VesB/CFA65-like Ig-like domain-containing protein n=1 Tax=Paragonimus westermani TaxID=34504 RepID=A0A5J4NWY7_9TREM|nr:uncharacterized protein DEA37_0013710 [Paragonimus westermani]
MDPTPLGESNVVEFTVTNVHVSSNPYTHPQPRIGSNGPAIPVQPTAYEIIPVESYFTLPQAIWDAPISNQTNTEKKEQIQGASFLSIYPQADTLEPDQNKRSSVSQKRPTTHKNSIVSSLKSKLAADALAEESEGTTTHFGQKAVEDSLQYRQAFLSVLRQYPSVLVKSNDEERENSATEMASDQLTDIKQYRVQLAAEYGSWPGTSAVYRLACVVADGPGSENAADLPPSFRVEIIGLEEQDVILGNERRLDFGAVLCGEYVERQLTVRNQTEAPVSFTVENDVTVASGTNNVSGAPVFMFIPNNGLILPGGSQSLNVTFAPEQPSDLFQQTFLVKLNNQLENSHTIQLSGCGKAHFMYVTGGDYFHGLDESVGSLAGLNDYHGIALQPNVDEISKFSLL